jgi:citrate lyase subunit beta/citryl-CoA lyase
VLAVSTLIRRSVLVVPLLDHGAVNTSWQHDADAIMLEPSNDIASTRELLPSAIDTAARGGAEVFVRIDKARAYAQIKAAVRPGLMGVVLPRAESAQDVQSVADMLAEREREEGVPNGELEILPLVDTANGVWNVREVVNASARVRCATVDEVSLCESLAIVPSADFDPFEFSRGRVIVETLAAVKLPLGIGHPLGARPREVADDELILVADRARNSGFKGAVCPFPAWVATCNAAFTPTEEQVAYYREVRKAFAEGVARGTAAVPFPGGRMIDVPVDERAKLVIDWWERCRQRDAQKAAARCG